MTYTSTVALCFYIILQVHVYCVHIKLYYLIINIFRFSNENIQLEAKQCNLSPKNKKNTHTDKNNFVRRIMPPLLLNIIIIHFLHVISSKLAELIKSWEYLKWYRLKDCKQKHCVDARRLRTKNLFWWHWWMCRQSANIACYFVDCYGSLQFALQL